MKNANPLFCLDIGTSSMKGALFDLGGNLLALKRFDLLGEAKDNFSTWDPLRWAEGLRRLIAELRIGGLSGVIMSGNGPTLVPTGKNGKPLFPALLWIDKREKKTSGQKSLFLPKAAWLQDNHPEIYEKTQLFLSCPEFLVYQLTGEAWTISPSDEFSEYVWTDKAFSVFGLAKDKFPPIIRPGREMGRITARAAEEFGLQEGVPVYSGGPDFLMSLVGTAATLPGRTCDRAGTSEGINYCAERPHSGAELRCLPHIVDGRYNIAGILSSTGRLFEWFRKLSSQESIPYEEMLITMQSASGTGQLRSDLPWFFPSMHRGGSWEFAKGMFVGLGAEHGKNEMGLAVVESIGFAVRQSVEVLENHGCLVDVLRLSGGQAKNQTWNRMKSDIIGKTLLVPETEDAELVGNLCAGLVGRGDFPDLVSASNAIVRFKKEYVPDPERHKWYSDLYETYLSSYSRFQTALKGCQ